MDLKTRGLEARWPGFGNTISLISLAVSLSVAYLTLISGPQVQLSTSNHVSIGNTYGGTPDGTMTFTFSANGSHLKTIEIADIRIALENQTTKKSANLSYSGVRGDDNQTGLPIILHGGTSVSKEIYFANSEQLSEFLGNAEGWFDELIALTADPLGKSRLESIKDRYLNYFYGDLKGKLDHRKEIDDNERFLIQSDIARSLKQISSKDTTKVVFFQPGTYVMNITAIGPSGNILHRQVRYFRVDEKLSEVLKNRFDENVYIRSCMRSQDC
jgi:hypothetical protein